MSRPSAYHRFCGAFVRTRGGALVTCTGPLQHKVRENWQQVWLALLSSSSKEHALFQGLTDPGNGEAVANEAKHDLSPRSKFVVRVEAVQQVELAIYETEEGGGEDAILGLVFQNCSASEADFDDVFARLLLRDIRLFTTTPLDNPPPHVSAATERIVDLFDSTLRYVVDEDKWNISGREYFHGRVDDFVRRGARVEFCLPAFPCKSSNLDKVSGALPDRGEQLALENLHSFVEAIEAVYEPGAKLWIVSDGHVFSDCIGVDDEVVDRYNAEIIRLNTEIGRRRRGADRVGFMSLVDIFDLAHSTPDITAALSLRLPSLETQIATKRTSPAELSRRMLLEAGRSNDSLLRARIESGEHSALKLYRGFSRFMAEDLCHNGYTSHLSRSKLKKLATKVSFEMMQRNEAYSNLVELIFPHHVRLSIHAHNNAGPKFGIRLLGRQTRALERLSLADAAEMRSVDLLHVPTPWHNCLVEVAGHPGPIMTKSRAVRDALARGEFVGGWVEGSRLGTAGRFILELPSRLQSRRCDGEVWDLLDYYDPGNPYLRGRDAVLEAEMRYWYASSAGITLS
ncbi:hypothetical protein RB595_006007 [Gaeumannomyces hyphopodioides]